MDDQSFWESLISLLPNPSDFGANSWVEVLYWIGGAIVALAATFNLRQNVKHARATFLLRIDDRWETLEKDRAFFRNEFDLCQARMLAQHGRLKDDARDAELRKTCSAHVEAVEQENPKGFDQFLNFIGFFETVGVMIRGRNIPLRDIARLYKGPILNASTMFEVPIQEWQKRAPDGIYDNALYLMRRVKRWEWRRRHLPLWRRLFGP